MVKREDFAVAYISFRYINTINKVIFGCHAARIMTRFNQWEIEKRRKKKRHTVWDIINISSHVVGPYIFESLLVCGFIIIIFIFLLPNKTYIPHLTCIHLFLLLLHYYNFIYFSSPSLYKTNLVQSKNDIHSIYSSLYIPVCCDFNLRNMKSKRKLI